MQYVMIPVTAFAQNATLLWDETTMAGAVVDPGGDLDRILAEAQRRGIRIEKILLTHGHIDHAGATAELAERLGVPIEGPHMDDAFWIAQLPTQSRMFGLPGARAFTPDRWLEGGDRVQVGNIAFEVIHAPATPPGHVVFYQAEARLAIVGDVLFAGSIGRTDFPRGDYQTLIDAIRQRLFPLGDDVTFIPGHGPVSTFGEERMSNPFVGQGA